LNGLPLGLRHVHAPCDARNLSNASESVEIIDTETGGFLVGDHHFNRWFAADAAYGYDKNTNEYFAPAAVGRNSIQRSSKGGGFCFLWARACSLVSILPEIP
jgi:hypothetical protein